MNSGLFCLLGSCDYCVVVQGGEGGGVGGGEGGKKEEGKVVEEDNV